MQPLPRAVLVTWLLLVAACGGDDGTDGPPSDAALGADSSEILPDAGLTTLCGGGDEEPVVYCERATEICVEIQDLGVRFDCVALPDGCDADRTCAACMEACAEPADTCADTGQDNTLSCSCIECV